MTKVTLLLSQVALNEANPRSISTERYDQLIGSLLVFPKMLEVRGVAIDTNHVALGGNMRLLALREIAGMEAEEIATRLEEQTAYQAMDRPAQEALLEYWAAWLVEPTVPCLMADDFTEAEKREFIIKDNVSAGTFEFDKLANEFDSKLLKEWGLNVWQMPEVDMTQATVAPAAEEPEPETKEPKEDEGTRRVTITYSEEQSAEVAALLGLAKIDKATYTYEELSA